MACGPRTPRPWSVRPSSVAAALTTLSDCSIRTWSKVSGRSALGSGAVKAAKGGAVEFRVEKAGIIHAGIGKASFPVDKLAENIRAFADAIVQLADDPGLRASLGERGRQFAERHVAKRKVLGDFVTRLDALCARS